MSRAELEAAAAERYPQPKKVIGGSSLGEVKYTYGPVPRSERAAYIRGRLDQAEADAQIADAEGHNWSGHPAHSMFGIAAAIREGVNDVVGADN